jgi:hypothetical protein
MGMPLVARLGVTTLVLAPVGFLMGIPFPAGIRLLTRGQTQSPDIESPKEIAPRTDIPWIWAVNGAASVVSPILAALLALTFGFSDVLRIGAFCYAGALFTAWVSVRPEAVRHPDQ